MEAQVVSELREAVELVEDANGGEDDLKEARDMIEVALVHLRELIEENGGL